MRILYARAPEEIAERPEDLSTKTKMLKESLIKEILEEHLADWEAKDLTLKRLNYRKGAERIFEVYGEVLLYSQNL